MNTESRELVRSFYLPLILSGLLLLAHLFLRGTDTAASALGLIPRHWPGIWRIATAPWVHGSWEHLLSNLVPLVLLGAGLNYFYREVALPVWLFCWLSPGLWVWIAARNSVHIGASGVTYALAFFLFFSGVFRRDQRSLTLALVVAMFYGSIVWGMLPAQEGISWESHLFGALTGIILAAWFRKSGPPPRLYPWENEPEHSPDDPSAPWNYKERIPPPEGFSYPGDQ